MATNSLTHIQRVRILYKTILRLHRGFPQELRELGDQYTKDEFKRHKSCSPTEANIFMSEWTHYALSVSEQLGLRGKPKQKLGEDITEDELQSFRDEQIVQLYELMLSSRAENKNSENSKI